MILLEKTGIFLQGGRQEFAGAARITGTIRRQCRSHSTTGVSSRQDKERWSALYLLFVAKIK
ncbi:hypothetical protein [Chitinimonas sp. BJB300]|uniref:hypothetical protein n=1 Tax=Chitinimonas sp. BJB300 TaxID=1559339 RepID=UPI001166D23F|nr:hypothetical protein [Chitinimonas sp. BJB300]TSJ88614.1 hypothetical protein FG002_010680 [Chitinimonas sp. BJB300]